MAASYGLPPHVAIGYTPYELSLHMRGVQKAEHAEHCRALSGGYLAGLVSRVKRPKPLRDYLPPEPKTQRERLADGMSGLLAFVLGKEVKDDA